MKYLESRSTYEQLLLKKKQITKLQNDLKGRNDPSSSFKVYLKTVLPRYCSVRWEHDYDKRESIKRREQERDIKRIIDKKVLTVKQVALIII